MKRYLSGESPAAPERRFNDELNESMGFLISDTARFVKRALYARIAQHGIRGGHWFCLRSLLKEDGVTQRELSQRLGITDPSTVEMLRAMEKEGLVRRERDAGDRRKMRVYLTEHARSIQPLLMKIAKDVNQIMRANMSDAEEALLKLLLRQTRDTLRADLAQFPELISDDDDLAASAAVDTKLSSNSVGRKPRSPSKK